MSHLNSSKRAEKASVSARLTAAAHLGFVNGAVQRIVLLVIQQTEVQGPQSGCEPEIRRRESKSLQGRKKQTYRSRFIASNVLMKKSASGTCQADK